MRLNREQITQQALALVDELGLDALTTRRIASNLDVRPSALYRHFKGKDELLSNMAEHILVGEFPVIPDLSSYAWNEWLVEVAMRYRNAMLSRRDGGRIIARAHPALALTYGKLAESTVRKLVIAGFSIEQAATICATVFSYVEGMTQKEQEELGRTSVEISLADSGLTALVQAKQSVRLAKDHVFTEGLKLIISGAEAQRLRPAGGFESK